MSLSNDAYQDYIEQAFDDEDIAIMEYDHESEMQAYFEELEHEYGLPF